MYHAFMSDARADFRIEDLSRASGVTVRNIRAYQSLRLLPPPRVRGRVGLYSAEHLDRLRAIARLQAKGFSLAAIRELLAAADRGATLEDVLGLPPRYPRDEHSRERGPSDAWLDDLFDSLPAGLPPMVAAVVPNLN
jgi:DNA-binding transcriptional MerR regulator